MAANQKELVSEKKLKAAFQALDTNDDGKLDCDEIGSILANEEKLDQSSLRRMIRHADLDGCGKISYSDFENLMTT